MRISEKAWVNYITKLSRVNTKAASLMKQYVDTHGLDDRQALIDYAYGVSTKYGEAAASLACEMYDATAAASKANVPAAVPADTPTYGEVAKTVNGTLKQSTNPDLLSNAVGRLVKRTGADTTLLNAERDGAQFAWVPHGDTCSFCIALASRGWQYMSKEALKGGHAEHIHANCDCTYEVRFDENTTIEGYDPDEYLRMYNEAEGSSSKDKINAMRRAHYAANPEKYRSQKRALYAKNNAPTNSVQTNIKNMLNGSANDRIDLANKILQDYNVNGVQTNVKRMVDRGYCTVVNDNGVLIVDTYNLQANDDRSIEYQIKTAFHEAYYASGNGYATDFGLMDAKKWLDIEETFAESSSHYMAAKYGIIDLSPAYSEKLVEMLPRLKQLPEFSGCNTIADFGKIAHEARQAGGGSAWRSLSNRLARKKVPYPDYIKQYFADIRKDTEGYVDKFLENNPSLKSEKKNIVNDLTKAMDNIDQYGFTLSSNESTIINNAVAIAMNRIGVY